MGYAVEILVFTFGLSIGSFLNCLAWRLVNDESMLGRSYCPRCRQKIAWFDNLPLLSFLILRGRCRHCKERISIQYPLVEILAGLLFLAAYSLNFQPSTVGGLIILLRDWLIIAAMIAVFVIDLRWYLILDVVTIPSTAVFFLLNIFLGFDWFILLISGIIGGSFFFVQYIISRGKWIGGGDIRLGFLMGVILGWPYVILAIFLAYIIGSLVAVPLLITKKKGLKSELPLGVFLSTSTIIVLLFGEKILDWYLRLLAY